MKTVALVSLLGTVLLACQAGPGPSYPPLPPNVFIEPGFTVTVFAEGLEEPSSLAFAPDGRLFVAGLPYSAEDGYVALLEDRDGDGAAETIHRFAAQVDQPRGITFHGDALYVAQRGAVTVLRDRDGDDLADAAWEDLITGLPAVGDLAQHSNNTIVFDAEGRLYFSLGSTCDTCLEEDPRNGAILRASADGTGLAPYAYGIRNAYELAFHPSTGALFGADNSGLGGLDPAAPPDELNVIAEGGHYGWPRCYGFSFVYEPVPGSCEDKSPPLLELPAHSAPAGMAFYTGEALPEPYREDLFLALFTHQILLRVQLGGVDQNLSAEASPFAGGFLTPVDIAVGPDGALYLADFFPGKIFRIAWEPTDLVSPRERRIGEGIWLMGFDLPPGPVRQGDTLHVALHWESRLPALQDYVAQLELLDSADNVVAEIGGHLASATYPTSQWPSGEALKHSYPLLISPEVPAGAYRLRLLLRNSVGAPEEAEPILLTTIELQERVYVFDRPAPQHPTDGTVEDTARLLGWDVEAPTLKPGAVVPVILYWEPLAPTDLPHKIFLHLVDDEGNLRAQHDGLPLDGHASTVTWVSGEIITDRHPVALPADLPPGTYRLYAGMYQEESGQRLEAFGPGGEPLPGGAIPLGEITVG